MNSFWICLNAILPIFIVVAAGYAAKRAGLIRESEVPRMNAVAFKAFMPVMCFYNVYTSDLSSAVRPRLMVFTVLGILAVFGLSLVCAIRFVKVRDRRGVVVQGMYRSNFLILGLALAAGLSSDGDLGVTAVMGAIVAPTFNVLAVITLEVYSGKKTNVRKLVIDIAKNPLIIGSLLGLLCLLLDLRLPSPLETAARDMARAASPLMLFLLGAFFRFSGAKEHAGELVAVCLGRLVIVPALVLSVAIALGFRDIELITLLAIFASSTAVASFTMAEQMGGDAALAGDIVVMTSALASLTLFGWSLLFKSLNLF